nr:immunoglobulin light chain junction region [Macaca mulatta]
CQQCNANPWTF